MTASAQTGTAVLKAAGRIVRLLSVSREKYLRQEQTMMEEQKQQICALMREPAYRPMKLKELCILLDVPRERRGELKAVLDALVAEGKIGLSPRGKYGRPDVFTLTGAYHGNPRGFGFVTVEGRDTDVFIPADRTGEAMDGDTVRISIEREVGRKRAEGRVQQVLEHAVKEVVGLYRAGKAFGFVLPDNQRLLQDIYVPEGQSLGAKTGDKVVVRLTSYGGARKKPEGRVTEVLGGSTAPGVDIRSVVRACGLPETFPEDVLMEAERMPETVDASAAAGRLDLRKVQMVTIDGDDAKDLDDAVSLSFDEKKGLYHLGVHIADVSAYVREGSALDREALSRGTSVYLPDRVLPMLPRALSNGICSLNQQQDRLALSCLMTIDETGLIVDHEIAETLIRVDRRMSYQNVNAIITKNDARRKEQYAEFVPMLLQMKTLSGLLRTKRKKRGGIDFDFPESKITLDQKGRPIKVEPYEVNDANRLIEDFMLAANETVAETYFWQETPFLYRTHEPPTPEKIQELSLFAARFGFRVHAGQDGTVHPGEIQKLLSEIDGAPEEALIQRMALRSMKQARYTVDCVGHFGLAARYYTYFTSPIRRYPDLQIHRIIKESLRGRLLEERLEHYTEILPGVAEQSSKLERRADEAERLCDKMKKAEYMRRFVGEEFDGLISGVTGFGFYVELQNTCEGLVSVTSLTDDYYIFDEARLTLQGEHTHRSFSLGQKVRIMVIGADKLMGTVDFRLADWSEEEELGDKQNGKGQL